MKAVSILEQLPELQQIESIVQCNNNDLLVVHTLCQIPWEAETLPVYALSLGRDDNALPTMTYIGGIHGLERIGTQVVLAFLESFLERLQWDSSLVELLQRIRINFIPLLNPAGMLNNTRANGKGIDLMRNAPIDSDEKTIWLGGGHRISPRLPWYRGKQEEPMQLEAQALCDFVLQEIIPAPFSLVLDCHSGFGLHNQIWFPYAKSRIEPIKHLGEIYFLRQMFQQTYPYQNYRFEPQSQHYLTHGDLWDYLYIKALDSDNIFLPLTLEMGSWRWIRKNPLQLRHSLGLFHPTKPHRINRVLRGHWVLMEFLFRASISWQNWYDKTVIDKKYQQALTLWYHDRL